MRNIRELQWSRLSRVAVGGSAVSKCYRLRTVGLIQSLDVSCVRGVSWPKLTLFCFQMKAG